MEKPQDILGEPVATLSAGLMTLYCPQTESGAFGTSHIKSDRPGLVQDEAQILILGCLRVHSTQGPPLQITPAAHPKSLTLTQLWIANIY